MSNYVQIYRNINKDITVGNFTARDLMLPVGFFAVAQIFGFSGFITIIGGGMSFWAMIFLKEINDTKLKGYYKSFVWWHGIIRGDYKTFPKSFEREFIK